MSLGGGRYHEYQASDNDGVNVITPTNFNQQVEGGVNNVTALRTSIERHPVDNHEHELRQSGWVASSLIVAGEVMGTGVMSLPHACAGIGWIPGVISLVLFGACAVYTGLLLSFVRNSWYPTANSYKDLANLTYGPRFAKFTEWGVLVYWAALMPYYLMAATNSLDTAFPNKDYCYYEWAVFLMVILIPTTQLRSLHSLRYAAALSTSSIIAALVLIQVSFIHEGKLVGKEYETTLLNTDTEFLDTYANMSSFVYAFAGHSLFLELLREMKRPTDFPKSIYSANTLMMAVYASTMAVGYYYRGSSVHGFLPASLAAGHLKTAVSLLLTYHIVCSYLITSQPLCNHIHASLWPHTVNDYGMQGKQHWFLLTMGFLVFSYVIANVIPFFSAFQNIIGAIMSAPVVFLFPPMFFLKGI